MTAPSREAVEALIDYLDEEAECEISSAGELTDLGKILRRHEVTARALLAQRERDEKVIRALMGYAESVIEDGCRLCGGDCSSENPPRSFCPIREVQKDLGQAKAALAARDAGGE